MHRHTSSRNVSTEEQSDPISEQKCLSGIVGRFRRIQPRLVIKMVLRTYTKLNQRIIMSRRITFKFHLNSNALKEAKAFAGVLPKAGNKKGSQHRFTFTGKVTPPMLKNRKGVLATRSPHRPNPIGITLARIDAVSKKLRCIFLG